MQIILLGGGSGTRLWPLSNEIRSKIFLKLLPADSGGRESMIQRLWRQLVGAGLAESAFVAANGRQLAILRNQLGPEVPVIVEPGRRDTFPAVALAAAYLHSRCGIGPEEAVCVLPADAYVEDSFFCCVKKLDNVLRASGADLALIGVKPGHPSDAYGYIVPAEKEDEARPYVKVQYFAEKPRTEEAQVYIGQHALWNCGVYAFKLGFLTGWLERRGYPVRYEQLANQYDRLPLVSFDHEVAEKTASIVVLPYAGQWKDLGTWRTLTEEMDTRVIGKGVISEDSRNTHLINELKIPITVLGLSDVIVASGPDGILVADKGTSPRVKKMMNVIDAARRNADGQL